MYRQKRSLKGKEAESRGCLNRLKSAFTLIELLVSMTILALLLLMLAQLLDQIQRTWTYSEGRISQFREARVAFDIITKNLSQAALNTYWDYKYDEEENTVESYRRQSELHFVTLPGKDLSTTGGEISGHAIAFQAPLGFSNRYRNLNNLFNARGYYVLNGTDEDYTPSILENKIEPKKRYRLMEYRPPAEENQIFIDGDEERLVGDDPEYTEWFRYDMEKYSHPLAENIVAVVISPRDTLEKTEDDRRETYSEIAADYQFDSNTHQKQKYRQQVPPLVRVTMVAIDEGSAIRLEAESFRGDLVKNTYFKSTQNFDKDVEDLKEDLSEKGVNFKVFSTMVALRSAKWSTYEIDP